MSAIFGRPKICHYKKIQACNGRHRTSVNWLVTTVTCFVTVVTKLNFHLNNYWIFIIKWIGAYFKHTTHMPTFPKYLTYMLIIKVLKLILVYFCNGRHILAYPFLTVLNIYVDALISFFLVWRQSSLPEEYYKIKFILPESVLMYLIARGNCPIFLQKN